MHSTRREDVLQTQCLACTVGKTREVETGCKMIGFEKENTGPIKLMCLSMVGFV